MLIQIVNALKSSRRKPACDWRRPSAKVNHDPGLLEQVIESSTFVCQHSTLTNNVWSLEIAHIQSIPTSDHIDASGTSPKSIHCSLSSFGPGIRVPTDLREPATSFKAGPTKRPLDPATAFAQQMRPRAHSDVYSNHRSYAQPPLVVPQTETAIHPTISRESMSPRSAEPLNRHSCKQSPLSDLESDPITGFVLASGKFKCSDAGCKDLEFGRQADFRRHHINSHTNTILEFFCPVSGCDRSKNPSRKSRGRSFKGRKDKMEEHVQNVHQKSSRKRGRLSETGSEADFTETDEENSQPQVKVQRQSL